MLWKHNSSRSCHSAAFNYLPSTRFFRKRKMSRDVYLGNRRVDKDIVSMMLTWHKYKIEKATQDYSRTLTEERRKSSMMEDWALATLLQIQGLTAQNCGWFDRGSERHDHGVLFLKYFSSILGRNCVNSTKTGKSIWGHWLTYAGRWSFNNLRERLWKRDLPQKARRRNLREEDRRKKWLSIKREKKIMKDT